MAALIVSKPPSSNQYMNGTFAPREFIKKMHQFMKRE